MKTIKKYPTEVIGMALFVGMVALIIYNSVVYGFASLPF